MPSGAFDNDGASHSQDPAMPSDDPIAPILLLTNDDGIEAPGIQALYEATVELGERIVIAPAQPCSGCGHGVTTHRPIPIHERADGWIGVEGTPADCVRLGLDRLAPGVQWVLSGINAGGNLGADAYYSGTMAAAREAALHGKRALAVSQYIARGRAIDWAWTATWARKVLRWLMEQPWEPHTFWNVNLPHPAAGEHDPEMVLCPLDASPLCFTFVWEGSQALYRGDYQGRSRAPGSDVDLCFAGKITITKVPLAPEASTRS
jgi:5'-nucleotidase